MKNSDINTAGFSLVELMIVMVLSLLLMGGVYMAYLVQNKTSTVQHQVTGMQQDLRAVMNLMAKDIRNAGCDQNASASLVGILSTVANSTSTSQKLCLRASYGSSNEDVFYLINAGNLTRNGQVLAENVTTLSFVYYSGFNNDVTSSLATDASQVDNILVTVVVQSENIDPDTGNYLTRTLSRRVRLRN